MKHCIFSFGGGVQSCAIYLLLLHEPCLLLEVMGELPSVCLFADTGAETEATLKAVRHFQSLQSPLFPIEICNNGNILHDMFADGSKKISYPAFIKKGDGGVGMGKRFCTSEYKIRAVQKAFRVKFNLTNKKLQTHSVSTWIGFSIDEVDRCKPSPDRWVLKRYPLIELGWSRADCEDYCKKHGWTPTKSRCKMCPYQSDTDWLELKEKSPEEFEEACLVDESIRDVTHLFGAQNFLHSSCIPLREVSFLKGSGEHQFTNECDGGCST